MAGDRLPKVADVQEMVAGVEATAGVGTARAGAKGIKKKRGFYRGRSP
jgi:hypothetical protein